ncbi:hypothetical protein NYR70_10120 [Actinobacillus equuli subsp. equuli]|uniref:hypothetical protein n=1 Tax=Actinobacillus equuli TaxID=718 RepID=UPI002440EEBB|nr:hypothetical protein [Actinobacillus equuli]WGE54971.1 hypothetical protein NYR70_10120 [Actinobacillus equuli subsp. equuli]
MGTDNYKENLVKFLFCAFYFINVFIFNFSNSQYFVSLPNAEIYIKYIKSFSYFLPACLLLLFYKLNKQIFFDLLLFLAFGISFIISGLDIITFIFFVLARYIPFSKLISSYLGATFLASGVVFITYLFDLYPESYLALYRSGENFYRSPMGYRFPTYFPNILLSVFFCWIYLRKENIRFIELIVILLSSYYVYHLTDTRTVFYFSLLLVFSVSFIKLFNVNLKTIFFGKLLSFFTIYGFFIFGGLSVYLQYIYSPDVEWLNILDKVLSGRLYYGNMGISNYPINLFGHRIEYIPMLDATAENPFFGIDSGFLKFLLDHGVLLFLLVAYGFYTTGKFLVRNNSPYFTLIVIFFTFQMTINPYLTFLDFNPFFYIVSYFSCMYKQNLLK